MSDQPSLHPLPAWERLAVPPGGALTVAALERVEVAELLIRDDQLPQLSDATLIWAWGEGDHWWLRAVVLTGLQARPLLVRTARLRVEQPDPALVALLGLDPGSPTTGVAWVGAPRALEPVPRQLACICRLTSADRVYRAIETGWRTVDEVKRATEVAFGECQGRRCVPGLARRLELGAADPRARITPRPPLVPVPASILAAFAGG